MCGTVALERFCRLVPPQKCTLVGRRRVTSTAVGGTADGTRRTTGDTLNMGESTGTGETLAWVIARDVPCSSPSLGVAHSGRGSSL